MPDPVRCSARAVAVALALGASTAHAQPARPVSDSAGTTAVAFVRSLERGAWDTAAQLAALTPPAEVTTEALLRGVWTQLVGQLGPLASLVPAPATANGESRIVDLGARFERSEVTLRVVVGPAGKVTGFWVTPPRAPAYTPPPYAAPARVREDEIAFGAVLPLPATVTLPRGATGRVPAVVLVHGSGPLDRDARVGANRPFRDLALGLAARGIAVLRYDKRTYVHPRALAGQRVTLEVEVIDDALAALVAARAYPGVDPARVFVVGHSIGATFSPDIADRDGHVAGVALLAPAGRSISQVALEQLDYLIERARAAGQPTASYEPVRAQLAALVARRLPRDTPVLGAPAWYWYDLDDRRPLELAGASRVPALAIFGGRDYQVTAADVDAWRKTFAGRTNATVEMRPAVNHLLVPGRGPSSPEEYQARPGHVEEAIVERLARWILAQPPVAPPSGR